jgi:hypothetical protein
VKMLVCECVPVFLFCVSVNTCIVYVFVFVCLCMRMLYIYVSVYVRNVYVFLLRECMRVCTCDRVFLRLGSSYIMTTQKMSFFFLFS